MSDVEKVRGFLTDLELEITAFDQEQELFKVSNEDKGVVDMLIDCEGDTVVIEQCIMPMPKEVDARVAFSEKLLTWNRDLIHGAFALTESDFVVYRDTLKLKTLDFVELQGSVEALGLGLAEKRTEILAFTGS